MAVPVMCEVCGNEVEGGDVRCPFCQARLPDQHPAQNGMRKRVVNLENNLPTVEDALARLRNEIETAARQGYQVLYLIHGYGSSGRGGAIRREVRRQLSFMRENSTINDFVPGEECTGRSGHWRQTLRRFPSLSSSRVKANPGVTWVIL